MPDGRPRPLTGSLGPWVLASLGLWVIGSDDPTPLRLYASTTL